MKRLYSIYQKSLLFISFFSISVSFLFSHQGSIKGKVVDKKTSKPLSAYVLIKETGEGKEADENGYFELNVEREEVTLLIHMLGYKIKEMKVRKGEYLKVELEEEPLPAHEVVVTADARVSDERSQKTVTLTWLDVYRIPGSSADPLYAAQVLPGVNSIPDASSLIIRGGAPDEVGFYFDGIEIKHPYQSESLKEGYFSIFDNQMIQNLTVSTSGFSTKYGDALSGVMDITTKDFVPTKEFVAGINILGINLFSRIPINKGIGFIGSLNAGHSELMSEINNFEGWKFKNGETIGKLIFNVSKTTNLKLLYLIHGYNLSHYAEDFKIRTYNRIVGLTMENFHSSNLYSKLTLSGIDYKGSYLFPDIPFEIKEKFLQGRFDLTWDLKENLIEGGVDFQKRINSFIPEKLDETYEVEGRRFGFYITDRFRIHGNLFAVAGIRCSGLDLSGWRFEWEPRLSLAYLPSKANIIRFSAGVYKQNGDYFTIKENPDLRKKTSYHFSLSYDWIGEKGAMRITFYEKIYRKLFLEEMGKTTNNGYGYARGAELFAKTERKYYDFKFVYNFLNSKRKEGDVQSLSRSPYEIDHSFTIILNLKRKMDSLGLRFSYARGLPYTPLLGREFDYEEGIYKPVWGEPYSKRFPPFRRVDLSFSKRLEIKERLFLFYLGIGNLFNHKNIFRYERSENYSSERAVGTIFKRSIFFGFLGLF